MREFGYYPLLYPSDNLSEKLRLDRLDIRKKIPMVLVAHKLLNGHIYNLYVLNRIAIYVPDNFTKATQHRLLIFPRGRSNLLLIMPLARMVTLRNNNYSDVYIFYLNL